MTLPPDDLAEGREAYRQTKRYERLRKGFLMSYLLPLCWLANAIVRYELKVDAWTRFQLVFWIVILILTIVLTAQKRRKYLMSMATLDRLEMQYGPDVSFADETETAGGGAKK